VVIVIGSNYKKISQVRFQSRKATSSSDYTFGYNNDGRLTSASLNSTSVGSYVYNGFEQRAAKTASGLTTNFVYDTAGHMIAEENGSTGAAIREYIWLDDLPVAMVDDTGSSPVIYYIHTDQLGTPQKISDGNANVVWDGVFDPFGNAVTVSGANWGTGVWKSFTWEPTTPEPTLLRFPGQYADAETALNQNEFRDYDPTIGRYVESDPVGLAGGINTYSYAVNDPDSEVDPVGLQALPWSQALPWGLLLDLLNNYLSKNPPRVPRMYACNARCPTVPTTCPPAVCPEIVTGYGVAKSLADAVKAARSDANDKVPPKCQLKHCTYYCTSPTGERIYPSN
jgi:RHS repeat-associated protein